MSKRREQRWAGKGCKGILSEGSGRAGSAGKPESERESNVLWCWCRDGEPCRAVSAAGCSSSGEGVRNGLGRQGAERVDRE